MPAERKVTGRRASMPAEGAAHGQRSQVPTYAIYVVCRIRVQAFGDVYTTCCYGRASRVAFLMCRVVLEYAVAQNMDRLMSAYVAAKRGAISRSETGSAQSRVCVSSGSVGATSSFTLHPFVFGLSDRW